MERIDLAQYDIGIGDGGDEADEIDEAPATLLLPAETAHLSLLVRSGLFAESHFGLRVSECDAPGAPARWGPVHQHGKNSYHYRHRAADMTGTEQAMRRFAAWAIRTHLGELAELIHNPGASVKLGKHVPSSFWGAEVWRAHQNHVHIAI